MVQVVRAKGNPSCFSCCVTVKVSVCVCVLQCSQHSMTPLWFEWHASLEAAGSRAISAGDGWREGVFSDGSVKLTVALWADRSTSSEVRLIDTHILLSLGRQTHITGWNIAVGYFWDVGVKTDTKLHTWLVFFIGFPFLEHQQALH